jgi:hypothetical protein
MRLRVGIHITGDEDAVLAERHQKRLNNLVLRWDKAMDDQILRWARRSPQPSRADLATLAK